MFEDIRRTLGITLAASILGVLAPDDSAQAYEFALPPAPFNKQAFHAAVEDGFEGEVMGLRRRAPEERDRGR